MTLPEFEPDTDLSGNYIVSGYDVSSGESIVEEVPAAELLESVVLRTEATAETQDVVDAINQFNTDNSQFWETFLADYESNYFKKNIATFVSPALFWIGSNGSISSPLSNTQRFAYCEVLKGNTYTVNDLGFPDNVTSSSSFRSGFVEDLNSPGANVISFHNFFATDPNGYTFTSPIDGYFIICINNSSSVYRGFNLIETLTYREDITKILKRIEANEVRLRSILFICLINFAYPIVISSFKNFFGGGKNV